MRRLSVIALALAFVALLIGAMLELGPAAVDLRGPVAAHLVQSGVSHTVTAVLLNYRGYDTRAAGLPKTGPVSGKVKLT